MAEQNLRKLLEKVAKEHQYTNPTIDIKAISSGGANFSSTLYIASISSELKEDLKIFAKIAILGEDARTDPLVDRAYEAERFFYTELAKTYEAIEDKHNVPIEYRFPKPTFYAHEPGNYQEIVVLEDLTATGFKCHDRMKSFNWKYASNAVEQMAKFHALSFAHQQEYPAQFKHLEVKYNHKDLSESESMVKMFTNTMRASYEVIKKEYLGKVKKLFEDENGIMKCMDLYRPRRISTLVHGDYRASNLMHREQDGEIEVIPVDYQTFSVGCPAWDLVYLVFTGSDQEFRKLHYHNLIEHYYTQLTLALNRLNLDVNIVYPREDFNEDLKEMQMMGLLIGVSALSLVTVDEDKAPNWDPEAGLDSFVAKPSKVCEERMNGIVEDFIKWGLF